MDLGRIKRSDSAIGYGIPSIPTGSGGNAGGSFREQLGGHLKEDYKNRVAAILDEMAALSKDLLVHVNMQAFERYLDQLKSLLSEIVRNAYMLDSEQILDRGGRQRIFSSVGIVDEKLDELGRDVLSQNSDRLDFLSKVDEIRGLLMDMLL
ncbi:Protein of unknown function [Sporobacter termitidis DSM 10068]|uniref:DUF327 domain-containing protein n=1 Tax=Sporobacter termitidis DSM 10068 TaxID=1123282 RepID=A0A1M5W9F8_9FIRM|nr:YaaR family protein [Sporobacter termitidis]SHH84152.1 Protein of unknown function [Sporobacter termitidis DSM 10068]